MRKFVSLIIVINTSVLLKSQTVRIYDLKTKEPVENVKVISKNFYSLTNSNGIAEIKECDTLTITHISYEEIKVSYQQLKAQNFKIYLIPKIHNIEEVVIIGNRLGSKATQIHNIIRTLDNKEIELFNPQTTGDALSYSVNAFVQKSQMGGGSPIIRGYEANKILLVVDGIRYNNAIFRSGHLQNVITVDINSLEKIEIIEGPSSLLYGSDALGGTIYLKTHSPKPNFINKLSTNGEVLSRYSSANSEKTIHTHFNITYNKFASLTSLSFSDFGDLRAGKERNPFYGDWGKRTFYVERIDNKDSMFVNNHPEVQKGSAYSQYDIMQKLFYAFTKNKNIIANFQYSTSSIVPRYDRLTLLESNGKPKFAEWYYGPQKRILTALNYNDYDTNYFYNKSQVIFAYQDIEESRHDRKFNKPKLNHRIENVKVFSLNADFQKKIIKENFLTYGIDIGLEKITSKAETVNIETGEKSPLDTRYPDGGSKMNRFSFFVHDIYEILPQNKLTLNAGFRYNYSTLYSKFIDTSFYKFPFKEINHKNNAITGNLGITSLLLKYLKIGAGWSSGYRTPNLDDVAKVFESIPGKVVLPNENIKPERNDNFDVNLNYFDNTFNFLISAFYTIYKDIITTDYGKYNGQDSVLYNGQMCRVLKYVNKNEAYITGCSGVLKIKMSDNFRFFSSLTYTYGRIKTDSTDYPLDHIPPIYGKTALEYYKSNFYCDLEIIYNWWKYKSDYNMIGEDNFIYATQYGMPAWLIVNINSSYSLFKGLKISAGIENILDVHYRVFSSNISAPGRNFKLAIRYDW